MLKHGRLAKLDMSGMTMVFNAADPKTLDTLEQGAKAKSAAGRCSVRRQASGIRHQADGLGRVAGASSEGHHAGVVLPLVAARSSLASH